MLYRDHIGQLGVVSESGQKLFVDGVEYLILGSEILLSGVKVADIEDFSFTLNGLRYNYVDGYIKSSDPDIKVDGYYISIEGFAIYQDSFTIDGRSYSISLFNNNKYELNKDKLVLTQSTNYTDTFRLYDSFLLAITNRYTDGLEASEESLEFRLNITENIGWLKSSSDVGSENLELSTYLNAESTTKYYKDVKTAYLDLLLQKLVAICQSWLAKI